MADIITGPKAAMTGHINDDFQPDSSNDEELRRGMELLFRAYRDFTREPDVLLKRYGFGRAHHRVLYFVGANPSITVNALLAILQITKQSLSRVLGQLIRRGFVQQVAGTKDRRQRLLTLTTQGEALEKELFASQKTLFAQAYTEAGARSVDGFLKVLDGLINSEGGS